MLSLKLPACPFDLMIPNYLSQCAFRASEEGKKRTTSIRYPPSDTVAGFAQRERGVGMKRRKEKVLHDSIRIEANCPNANECMESSSYLGYWTPSLCEDH